MTRNNSKYSIEEMADIALGSVNFIFGIFAVIFAITFIAPLVGGVFHPWTIVSFVYWTGYYFLLRFLIRMTKQKRRLKNYQYLVAYIYVSVPIITIIPKPYNFAVFVIMALWYLKGLRAYFRYCADENNTTQETQPH